MSRPRNEPPLTAPSGPEGATLTKDATVTGVVRTSKGFAVARVVISPNGAVKSVRLGLSQAERRFVAMEHARTLAQDANAA